VEARALLPLLRRAAEVKEFWGKTELFNEITRLAGGSPPRAPRAAPVH
jgi:hypothetical protein